ncbi:peptidoglycan-binding domain-containing protein [Streptomyces sp. NPDC002057]|uniref:peptidoglycan-binding domain-containing protein n=1 Tax=Streptomyces sp. NPDC002057 TaxID=3154664 RepID=UPI0033274E44
MRDRTALTTAVTSGARETAPPPAQGNRVFGKVAGLGGDGPGAREQDVELFDSTLSVPKATGETGSHGRHKAGKPRYVRKSSRSRRAPRKPSRERQVGMSLPLLLSGALAAGIGLTVGLTSGLHRTSPDSVTLTMPDLPSPSATPETEPPATTPPATKPTTTRRTSTRTTALAAPTTSAPPSGRPSRQPPPTSTTTPPTTHEPKRSPTRGSQRPEQPDEGLLRLGSTGPEVEDLQRRLQQLYLYLGVADGMFGEAVEVALSRYQAARNIPEKWGVYGPLTRAALRAETDRDDREDHDDRDDWGDRDDWHWDD